MVFGYDKSVYDAILFVDNNQVVKEMLYAEFEAVLDGIVGEPDFADQIGHAVYLKIDRSLTIIGAVFFLIEFDEEGNVDPRWNLPLRQLVDTAPLSTELHGVRIRVACASQCQIPWHQQELWEPDLSAGSNTLRVLDASIKANKLGLIVDEDEQQEVVDVSGGGRDDRAISSSTTAGSESSDDNFVDSAPESRNDEKLNAERLKMARNIKKQRSFIANLKARYKKDIEKLKIQAQKQAAESMSELVKLQRHLDSVHEDYQQTVLELENTREQMQEQQQEFDRRFADVVNQHGVDHKVLEEKYRKDFQKRLIEQTSAVKEQLEMREVEVYYREEQVVRLNKEVEQLRASIERMQSMDVNAELESLVSNGVHFVVSEPGLGPLSIDARDLVLFNENPVAYLAERVGIECDVYQAWRDHVASPTCNAESVSAQCCGAPLDTVSSPQEFCPGQSDRCPAHQEQMLRAAAS